jgi:hypothetical protein
MRWFLLWLSALLLANARGASAQSVARMATWNLAWMLNKVTFERWTAACETLGWAPGASPADTAVQAFQGSKAGIRVEQSSAQVTQRRLVDLSRRWPFAPSRSAMCLIPVILKLPGQTSGFLFGTSASQNVDRRLATHSGRSSFPNSSRSTFSISRRPLFGRSAAFVCCTMISTC